METLLIEDVVPQTLVFGYLPGGPWWPAVIGRCPATGECRDREQRCWAFLFGSRYGTWLRIRDIRPYTAMTKKGIPEINALLPSYTNIEGRVLTACGLADDFKDSQGTGMPTSHYCGSLTGEAIDMPHLPRWEAEGSKKPSSAQVPPPRQLLISSKTSCRL